MAFKGIFSGGFFPGGFYPDTMKNPHAQRRFDIDSDALEIFRANVEEFSLGDVVTVEQRDITGLGGDYN